MLPLSTGSRNRLSRGCGHRPHHHRPAVQNHAAAIFKCENPAIRNVIRHFVPVVQEQQSEFGLAISDSGHGSAQGFAGYCAGASEAPASIFLGWKATAAADSRPSKKFVVSVVDSM